MLGKHISLSISSQGIITDKLITRIIADEATNRIKYQELMKYYSGNVPILSRTPPDTIVAKTNNLLANDFAGTITDSKVAMSFGKDVKYIFEEGDEVEIINKWMSDNFYHSNNNILGTLCSVCGTAFRLLYWNDKAELKDMVIPPTEAQVYYNQDTNVPDYGIIYYTDTIIEDGVYRYINVVEFYDSTNVYIFQTMNQNGSGYTLKEARPHYFSRVPLVQYNNNINNQGDFQKVLSLIDDYDRILSDNSNEISEVGNAILAITGINVSEDDIANLKSMRYVGIPSEGKVEFITKNINNTFVENHLKILKENIFKFSKCVDFSSEQFSGASSSGEARKWQILSMLNDSVNKHQLFINSELLYWKLISEGFLKKNIEIIIDEINPQISLPSDLLYESQVLTNLVGKVSRETAYKQCSFIKDPEKEVEDYEEEQAKILINTQPIVTETINEPMSDEPEPEMKNDVEETDTELI